MAWLLSTTNRRWQKLQRLRDLAVHNLTGSSPVVDAYREVLQQSLPDPATPLSALDFLAIDLETSGLDIAQGEIISIGWVPITAGRIQLNGGAHWLVAAQQSVGKSAVIHGIRDCDRTHGAPLVEVLLHLFTALRGRWPVFHHGGLDLGFLSRACEQAWQVPWPTLYVDTLRWQQRRLQRAENTGKLHLGGVMAHHQLPARSAHNALDDAQSCAEVLITLMAQHRATIADVGETTR